MRASVWTERAGRDLRRVEGAVGGHHAARVGVDVPHERDLVAVVDDRRAREREDRAEREELLRVDVAVGRGWTAGVQPIAVAVARALGGEASDVVVADDRASSSRPSRPSR